MEPTDPTELAWAAGFFEGEGCIYVPPINQGRGLRLDVAQSNDDGPPPELMRFQAAVGGFGNISTVPADRLSRMQRWRWRVQRRELSIDVLMALRPYVTDGMRERIDRAIEE